MEWGSYGSLEAALFAHFLLAFHGNCPYLASFLRFSEMLVENRRFLLTPPVFSAAVRMTLLKFRRGLWRQKTIVLGLSYGVVCVILRLAA